MTAQGWSEGVRMQPTEQAGLGGGVRLLNLAAVRGGPPTSWPLLRPERETEAQSLAQAWPDRSFVRGVFLPLMKT